MRNRPPVYGLDIETDTTVDGLDPAVAAVVTAALVGPLCEEVFTGPEDRLLVELDERLSELEPGVIATWNGAAFDLPFIANRAALHGLPLGLRLQPDPAMRSRPAPLRGQCGSYRARWFAHRHLDAYRVYRGDLRPAPRVSCALQSIVRFLGLAPVEADHSLTHDLTNEALHARAASDARLARILTERRWASATRWVDRFVDTPATATA